MFWYFHGWPPHSGPSNEQLLHFRLWFHIGSVTDAKPVGTILFLYSLLVKTVFFLKKNNFFADYKNDDICSLLKNS